MSDKIDSVAGDALSAEEQAFFETEGSTDVAAQTAAPEQPAKAEAEAVAKPEGEGEAEGGEKGGDKPRNDKGQFVPHQALHSEREEHKKTKAELNEIRQRSAVMEDRFNTLLQAINQQQQKPQVHEDPEPDPNTDIFAHQAWTARQIKRTQQELAAAQEANQRARAEEAQRMQAAQAEKAVWDFWEQSSAAYMKENPDFGPAAKWLSDTRHKQLEAFARVDRNFESPKMRNAQIEAELKQIIIEGARQGINPADAVYNIALSYGYQPASAQPAKVEPTAADKIATIAAAQSASKTVATAPGKAGGDEITMEQVLSMSDQEFDKWAKANPSKMNQLLGG